MRHLSLPVRENLKGLLLIKEAEWSTNQQSDLCKILRDKLFNYNLLFSKENIHTF